MDKGKIEERAIGVLRGMVNDHPIMEENIQHHDKYMSWDGTISVYENADINRTKENYMGSIQVQVKGHINDKRLNKEFINEIVSVRDLKVYYKTNGCVYFQIILDSNNKEASLYYASLYTSKLKSLIKIADKNHLSNMTIKFNRVDNCYELDDLLKQFLKEINFQGTREGQIVPKTICLEDLKHVSNLEIHSVYNDEMDIMKHIVNGDICVYTDQGAGFKVPVEWTDDIELVAFKIYDAEISINDQIYYHNYKVKRTIDGKHSIILGECITLDFDNKQYNFKPSGTVENVYEDSVFIRKLYEEKKVCFGPHEIILSDITLNDDVVETLDFFTTLGGILQNINFRMDMDVSKMSEKDKIDLQNLYQIKIGKSNIKLDAESNVYYWSFEEKVVPLIIRKSVDNEIKIEQAIYDDKYALYLDCEKYPRIPIISVLDIDVFKRLYKYEVEWFDYDIKSADLNEYTLDYYNEAGLRLIIMYDVTGNLRFLDIAERVYDGIYEISSNYYVIINKMQVLYRRRKLSYEEMKKIDSIHADSTSVSFAKYVLLNERDKAIQEYNKINSDEKIQLDKYPIMTLYNKLI